jgi:hypothetical protein
VHLTMLAQSELIFRLLLKMTVGRDQQWQCQFFEDSSPPFPSRWARLGEPKKRWICASAAPPLPKITLWRPGRAQLLPTFQAKCNARTVGMSAPFLIRPDTNQVCKPELFAKAWGSPGPNLVPQYCLARLATTCSSGRHRGACTK